MKRTKITTILMASFLLLSGCGGGSSTAVEPSAITVSSAGNVTNVEVAKTLQLTAVVHPEGAEQSVTWSSTDATLATVSSTGLVTGVKAGSTFITAISTLNAEIKKDFALTISAAVVEEITPTSVVVSSAENATELEVDKKLQLTAVVAPAGAAQQVLWSSASDAVATVNPDGNVSGKSVGSVVITATAKDFPAVKGSITLTVKEATPPEPTEDWPSKAFSTHAEYMDAANDTPLKVKGKVSHISPVYDDGTTTTVNYYLQDGTSGFYIYGQNAALYPVEEGKSYEVGGFKKYHQGANEIVNIEYFEELAVGLEFTVNNVSTLDVTDRDVMSQYHSSWVQIDVGLLTKKPLNYGTSAFGIDVEVNGKVIAYRVDPMNMSETEFEAISLKVEASHVGAALSAKGVLTAFGYGTPKNQLHIMKAADLEVAALTPEQTVTNAALGLSLPGAVKTDVVSIALPSSMPAFDGVVITWESANPAVISNTGVVTHAAATVEVKLTATLKLEDATATKDIVVTVYGTDESLLTVVHTLDLEDALPDDGSAYGNSPTKSGYKEAVVNLGNPKADWSMDSLLIGGDGSDKRDGSFAMRMQNRGRLELRTDFDFNMIEFDTAVYGTNSAGMVLEIEYSVDQGATWVTIERTVTVTVFTLEPVRILLPHSGLQRIALVHVVGTGQRINIDNLKLIKQEIK